MTIEVSGVDKIISQLNDYKKYIDSTLQEAYRHIGDDGVAIARGLYAQSYFDDNIVPREGEHFNLSVEQYKDGVDVVSEGSEVGFIEFGAGVFYPDRHPVPHPSRGSYGLGMGNRQAWVYSGSEGGIPVRQGKRLTHGTPSNMVMFFTSETLGRDAVSRIWEEFQK